MLRAAMNSTCQRGSGCIVGKPEVIVGSNDTSRSPEITFGAVGAGGMGEVYRVRGARLAVKILPKHVSIVPIRKQSWQEEMWSPRRHSGFLPTEWSVVNEITHLCSAGMVIHHRAFD